MLEYKSRLKMISRSKSKLLSEHDQKLSCYTKAQFLKIHKFDSLLTHRLAFNIVCISHIFLFTTLLIVCSVGGFDNPQCARNPRQLKFMAFWF